MGSRGPKPRPTALRVLAGDRPDRIAKAEPTPVLGVPEPPEWLNDAARAEWDRLAPKLAEMRVLTEADGVGLAALCEAVSLYVKLSEALEKVDLTANFGTGAVKLHPLVAAVGTARREVMRALAEFGLTPSSRSRITAVEQEAGDELDRFLGG